MKMAVAFIGMMFMPCFMKSRQLDWLRDMMVPEPAFLYKIR
jgi:hypothetical protein